MLLIAEIISNSCTQIVPALESQFYQESSGESREAEASE